MDMEETIREERCWRSEEREGGKGEKKTGRGAKEKAMKGKA